MGLAKTAFLTMVRVMAVNLRLLERWRARQARRDDYVPAPVRRKPRRRTRLLADTRAHRRRASPGGRHRRARPGTTTAGVAAAPR